MFYPSSTTTTNTITFSTTTTTRIAPPTSPHLHHGCLFKSCGIKHQTGHTVIAATQQLSSAPRLKLVKQAVRDGEGQAYFGSAPPSEQEGPCPGPSRRKRTRQFLDQGGNMMSSNEERALKRHKTNTGNPPGM
ncbi:hypothetical protein WJX77_012377 [Trebouxia sp. C0004]